MTEILTKILPNHENDLMLLKRNSSSKMEKRRRWR